MGKALLSAALLVFAVVALVAQEPDQPPRHDRYGKDDPKAYCLAGEPLPSDTHGHKCACHPPPCLQNGERDPNALEDPTCVTHCESKWCVCHVDTGCEPGAM